MRKVVFGISEFYNKHRTWFANMFGGFVATALGIAVTLGVSNYKDYKKNKEIIRATVFNGLTDFDNYEDYLNKNDSLYFDQFYWLPKAIEQYYNGDSLQIDSLAKTINTIFGRMNMDKSVFFPTGKEFLVQRDIENVEDMETFRIINIAYEDISLSQSFVNELNSCVEDLSDEWYGMYFSLEHFSNKDVVHKLLSHKSAYKLYLMQKERFILDNKQLGFFDYYRAKLNSHKERILKFSRADNEDYQQFKEQRLLISK